VQVYEGVIVVLIFTMVYVVANPLLTEIVVSNGRGHCG